MGYYIEQVDSQFVIKKENIQNAWDALRDLFTIQKKATHDSTECQYAWVNAKEVLNAKTFCDAMFGAGWNTYINPETGDAEEITFVGFNYGDKYLVLGVIAPFVKEGSYIILQGEDGKIWKYKFTNNKVKEIPGRIVFDDEIG